MTDIGIFTVCRDAVCFQFCLVLHHGRVYAAPPIDDEKPFLLILRHCRPIPFLIQPALGAVRLPALNTPTIQAFYNKLQKGNDGAPGLSLKTIKNLHGVVHKSLEQAVEIGYIRLNPADACKLPRVEKPEIKPLDDANIAAFLEAIMGDPYETLFLVDLFTGMRQGEILGLTWDCVDFKGGSILVSRQLQKIKGKYQIVSLKNDKRIAESIGVPAARFHDLRHSYAVASCKPVTT